MKTSNKISVLKPKIITLKNQSIKGINMNLGYHLSIKLSLFIICSWLITGCVSTEEIVDKKTGMNGGFEVIKNGIPVNWYFSKLEDFKKKNSKAENDFDIISDDTDIKEGKRSLKFVVRKCSPKGIQHSPGIFQEFESTPGADYKVSFWVKNIGSKFKIYVRAITVKGGSKELNEDKIIESKETIGEWKQYIIDRHIPNDLDRIRFELVILEPGTFQIDDIKIEKVK